MCDLQYNVCGEELTADIKNDVSEDNVFWDLSSYSESESSEDDYFNKFIEPNKTTKANSKSQKSKTSKTKHKICKYCDKSIEFNRYKHHIKSHQNYKEYFCKLCPKVFHTRTGRDKHKESHEPKKTFICDKCGSCFATWASLYGHSVFHNTKLYNCPHCSKDFHKKYDLNMHLRTHTGERPHACLTCFTAFRTPGQLKRHVKTVHDQITNHECQTCGECFHHAYMLKQHEDTHSGSRENVCSTCNKGFRTKNQLFRHSRSHTGAKPFKCNICEMCFSDSSNRKRHMYTHGEDKVAEYFKKPIVKHKNKKSKPSKDSTNLNTGNSSKDNDDEKSTNNKKNTTTEQAITDSRATDNRILTIEQLFKEEFISDDDSGLDNVGSNDLNGTIECIKSNNTENINDSIQNNTDQDTEFNMQDKQCSSPILASVKLPSIDLNIIPPPQIVDSNGQYSECNINEQNMYLDITDALDTNCVVPVNLNEKIMNRFGIEYFDGTAIKVSNNYPLEYISSENGVTLNEGVESINGTINETKANVNFENESVNEYVNTANVNDSLSEYLIIRENNMPITDDNAYVDQNLLDPNSLEEFPLMLLDADLHEDASNVYEIETNLNISTKAESFLKMLVDQGTVMCWDDKTLNSPNIIQEDTQVIAEDSQIIVENQSVISENVSNNDLLQFAYIMSNDYAANNQPMTDNLLLISQNNVQVDTNNFNSFSTYSCPNDMKMDSEHLQNVDNENLLSNVNSFCDSDELGYQGTININDFESNLNIPNTINGVIFKMPDTLSITRENLVCNKNMILDVSPAVTITREYNL